MAGDCGAITENDVLDRHFFLDPNFCNTHVIGVLCIRSGLTALDATPILVPVIAGIAQW